MPRGGIKVPKDSIKQILQQNSKAPPLNIQNIRVTQRPGDDETANRRRQLADEYKAFLEAKEAAKAAKSIKTAHMDAKTLAEENDNNCSIATYQSPAHLPAPDLIHSAPSSPPIPIISPVPILNTTVSQVQRDKERFIVAMEHGVSRANTREAISVDAEFDEALDRLKRQQAWKEELERQMEEKKQAKQEEKAREREWEAQEEARIAIEREKLKKEFEAEHAARLAKVSGEEKEQPTMVSDTTGGIEIFVPKKRAARKSSQVAAVPNQKSLAKRAEALTVAPILEISRNSEPSTCISSDPAPKPIQSILTFNEVSSLKESLTQQVVELKNLQETFERRYAEVFKDVLNLVKNQQAVLPPSTTALPTSTILATTSPALIPSTMMSSQPQGPVILQPLILSAPPHPATLGSIDATSTHLTTLPAGNFSLLSSLHQLPTIYPFHGNRDRVVSMPILHSATELAVQDSRPVSRLPAVLPKVERKCAANVENTTISKNKNVAMSKLSSTKHKNGGSAVVPEKPRQQLKEAAQKLTMWKRTKNKVKRLSVVQKPNAQEPTWWVAEESSAVL